MTPTCMHTHAHARITHIAPESERYTCSNTIAECAQLTQFLLKKGIMIELDREV